MDWLIDEDERKELEWLNSEGYQEAIVRCHKCGREYEELLHKVRYKEALKNDTFFCEKCNFFFENQQ